MPDRYDYKVLKNYFFSSAITLSLSLITSPFHFENDLLFIRKVKIIIIKNFKPISHKPHEAIGKFSYLY